MATIKTDDFEGAFPNDWDVFLCDPDVPARFQSVRLEAVAPHDAGRVHWYVDGQRIASRPAPFHWRWRLRPGRHQVQARDDRGRCSREVRFVVR